MLSNKYPIDKKTWTSFGIKEDPLKILSAKIKSFSKKELEKQAETLRPFLFDETGADLVANVQKVIPLLLDKYK